MEFEDIQKSWQAQSVQVKADNKTLNAQTSKWEKNQQRLLRSNICMSLGFVAAMIGIGWVYFSYHEEFGMPFKISIAFIYILMIVFSVVSWRSYSFNKNKMHDSSQQYIEQLIGKLKWQKAVITKYTFVYVVILWMALMLYIWEITKPGSPTFKFFAYGITTLYIVGITAWTHFRKKKKQLVEIESIIADLEAMKSSLNKI